MLDTSPPQAWKLQDAKARFSELVRAAQAEGPQTVTLHGRPAVVVLSAEEYARLVPAEPAPTLFDIMQSMPPGLPEEFEFGQRGDPLPVRDPEP
ncbi:type II toxin-antitoxin system Phd/YefM family antitoxin [Siccirubricoccus phaeus]|uniref:type II toxin-antitoxin system Phd/YefM family antitoxin n=1 Tax=Siccirubricoccus phaeus TaxID=2595053 RepID=UPI0011F1DF70|nr:type II toxin-antitoxin system Phd/YefM family antitoxin [Siccirubricoccus phaeus]